MLMDDPDGDEATALVKRHAFGRRIQRDDPGRAAASSASISRAP
jgi:hypothetical protein